MPDPIHIRMGGYGPPTTGFSRALKRIGDRLAAEFGERIEVKYVWNIMDLGYRAEDILWLVEHGLLTLGYQSSSYLTERVPELGIADLPFLFPNIEAARAAMDGRFSVAIDDIKKVAIPVLRHRVSTNFQAQAEGKASEDVIGLLLAQVSDPDVPKYERRRRPDKP